MTDYTTVRLPDGTEVRFPSSMSDEDIKGVMQERFPATAQPIASDKAQAQGFGAALGDMAKAIPIVGEGLSDWMGARSPDAQARVGVAMQKGTKGLSLGSSDELVAGATALAGGDYARTRAAMNALDDAQGSAYPRTSLASEATGAIATGVGAARSLPILAGKGVYGGAAVGAVEGGLYGFADGEGGFMSRTANAVPSAIGGAVLGGTAGYIVDAAAPVVRNLIAKGRFALEGRPTSETIAILEELGLDPAQIDRKALVEWGKSLAVGIDEDLLKAQFSAEALPVPVKLTRGQRTGDPDALRLELSAYDGNEGGKAREVAFAARDAQQDALQANAAALRETITGDPSAVPYSQGGAMAGERVARNAGDAHEQASSARRAAEQGTSTAPGTAFSPVIGQLRAELDELGHIGGTELREQVEARGLAPLSNMLEKAQAGQLPTAALLRLRGDISRASKSRDPAAHYLGKLASRIDDQLDAAVEHGLIRGDADSVAAFQESTSLWRDYFKRYAGKDGARKLIARMNPKSEAGRKSPLEPEQVSNVLFGKTGFSSGTRGLSLARELRKELGTDSAEWKAIRGEALTRLFKEGGERSPGRADPNRIGVRFATQLDNALKYDGPMMREMFDADEIASLQRFARVVRLVEARPPNLGNPSGSGNYLMYMMRQAGGKGWDSIKGLPLIRDIAESLRDGHVARKVERSVNPPI